LASYSADISVKVVGLNQLKGLEDRLKQVHDRFSKVNSAAARITAPFEGHIRALQQVNTLLQENARLMNQQTLAAAKLQRAGGVRSGGGSDPAIERERTAELKRQLQLLKERARNLQGNTEVMAKLLRAEVEISGVVGGNIRLGKELINNANKLLQVEEQRARKIDQAAAKELKNKQHIWQQQAKALADQERAEAKLVNQRVADAERVAKAEEAAAKKAASARARLAQGAKRVGGAAIGAVDGAFGNPLRGIKNGLIRGATVLGASGAAIGVDQMVQRLQSLSDAAAGAANAPVVGGLAKGIAEVTQMHPALQSLSHTLGTMAGQWGAAAAATAVFLPLLPGAASNFAKVAEKIDETTGASKKLATVFMAAQTALQMAFGGGTDLGAIDGLEQTVKRISNLDQMIGRLQTAKNTASGKIPGLDRHNASAGLTGFLKDQDNAVARAVEAERAATERVVAARGSWADALKEGLQIQKEIRAEQQAELQATRATEQAASDAARARLQAAVDARRNGPREVQRRTVSEYNFPQGLGPAANPAAIEGAVQNSLNRRNAAEKAALGELAQIEMALDRQVFEAELDQIQRGLRAETDAIETLTQKRLAADKKVQDDWDQRMQSRDVVRGNAADAAAKRSQRMEGVRSGVGAGLAMANIPGQAIFQAAAIGGATGGPWGAAAGAVTGLGVAAVQTGGEIAKLTAELGRSQQALQGISVSTLDYQQSMEGVERIATRLNIPLAEAAQQYTQLRAATAANGYTAAETLKVFESLAAANTALGGDSQRLQGILLATSQVFSKGKVAAEELRGQIGERLAGAFAEFARASGKSTQELDAALQNGEVSLDDFLKFAEHIGKKYGSAADDMAQSSENAGARLSKAWERAQLAIGPTLQKIGSAIQNFATWVLNAIEPVLARINDLANGGARAQAQIQARSAAQAAVRQRFGVLGGLAPGAQNFAAQYEKNWMFNWDAKQKDQAMAGVKTGGTPVPRSAPTPPGGEGGKTKKDKLQELHDFASKNAAELAQTEIALNRQVFENDMALMRQKYEAEKAYLDKLAVLKEAGLPAGSRDIFSKLTDYNKLKQGYEEQKRQAAENVAKARQDLADAKAGVGIAALNSQSTVVGTTGGGGAPAGSAAERLMAAANRNLGLFAGQSERCADAMRVLFKEANIGIGVTKKAWDGLESGASLASSFFGSDIGQKITNIRDLRPGDLVGFERTYGNWGPGVQTHVGIYAGNGMMYDHSSRRGLVKRPLDTFGGKFMYGVRPTALGGVAGATSAGGGKLIAPGGQADATSAISAQGDVNVAQAALDGAVQLQTALNAQIEKTRQLDFPTLMAQIKQAYADQTADLNSQTNALQVRNRLEMEGMRPELIEAEMQKLKISEQLQDQIIGLDEAFKAGNISEAERAQLLDALTQGANAAASAFDDLARAQLEAADPINQKIAQLQRSLGDSRGMIASLAGTIESEFGSAMSNAITGAITGTQTVQEAFSQMFANIGKAFIDMATQMLAQQAVLGILKMFTGAVAGGGSLDFGTPAPAATPTPAFLGGVGFAGGGYTGNGARSGGLDGQGGFLTMLHPQETVIDHTLFDSNRAALAAGLMAAEGGGATTDDEGGYGTALSATRSSVRETQRFQENRTQLVNQQHEIERRYEQERMAQLSSPSGKIDVRYEASVINEVRYVTEEQHRRGLSMAAQQGRELALSALQTSVKARKRTGIA